MTSWQDKLTDFAFRAATHSPDGHVSTQLPGREDGIADAYRHVLGAAEMARKLYFGGGHAELYGLANEIKNFESSVEQRYMDLWNNDIGIQIGNHVRANNGTWNDVVNLTQEYFGKALDGFVPSDITSSNSSWDEKPNGALVLTQNITLDNGLVLKGLSVLDVSEWSGNPLDDNGNELSNADSNLPDANGNWLNNFVPETFNYDSSYSMSTPVTFLGNGHFTEINGKITYITDQASGLSHSEIMNQMGSEFERIANASTNQDASAFANVGITIDHNNELRDYHIHIGSDNTDSYNLSEDYHIIEEDVVGGNDIISYSSLQGTEGVSVDLGVGNAYVGAVTGQAKDLFTNIENVVGSDNNDTIWGNDVDNLLEGRDGADEIRGFQGDDTIDAGEGNNSVEGGNGADSITAGTGNDVIYANEAFATDTDADYIDGGAGNDTIYGSGGNDTLIGGAGDDVLSSKGDATLMGGAGVDYYTAKAGDVIIDTDGGRVNNIEFVYTGELLWRSGSGVNPFAVVGNDLRVYTDVTVQSAPADEYFTIQNFTNDGSWGFTIPQAYYDAENPNIIDANGESAPTNDVNPENSSTPLSQPSEGHPNENPSVSNPTINAHSSNQHEHGYTNAVNYFIASLGFDTQEGGAAEDIYEWDSGNNHDEIIESGGTTDRIILSNLNASDVVTERFGDDVRIRVIATNETLTVKDHFVSSAREVETLEYADGTTLNLAVAANGMSDINEYASGTTGADMLEGNGGNDTLYGSRGNDMLIGGLDDDILQGDRHDDTYQWAAGDGNDTIIESSAYNGGNDTLHLTGGITLTDLDIYGSTSQDVLITYLATGEVITLQNQVTSTDVEQLLFDDATTFDLNSYEWRGSLGADSLQAGAGADAIVGLNGDDTLYGGNGNDTLTGGIGDDTLKGHRQDDHYKWSVGDGNDTIIESSAYNGGNDTLQLGAGITAAHLDIYANAGKDLMITHIPTNETITITDQYAGYDVETLLLDDGTTVNLLQTVEWRGTVGNDTISGTSGSDDLMFGYGGNDSLYGSSGNDTLNGGSGNDTLYGYKGDDVYVWQSGDGNDLFKESNTSNGGADIIELVGGIVETDLSFAQNGYDLEITHTPSNEIITIYKHYSSDNDYKIETIQFDDGSIFDLVGI